MLITGVNNQPKTQRASQTEEKSSQANQENPNPFDPTVPIMIFCQPNAGYYEAMLQDVKQA